MAAGFLAGVGISFLYHWSVISSGASAGTMGQAAEEWTESELRRLRRKGWKHVNHLVIKKDVGDVDHVAVGPDGVLVIETKWRSADIDVDKLPKWIGDAVWQAKRNREDVRRLLGWREHDGRPIEALVVLWGPDITHESAEAVLKDDVNVIAGRYLRDELAALSDVRLDPTEVDDIYSKLKQRIDERDEWEKKNLAAAPITIRERASQWAQSAAAGWTGLFLALLTLSLGWWSLVAIGALVLLSLAARRFEWMRSEATSFLVGVVATVPLILVAVLWSLR